MADNAHDTDPGSVFEVVQDLRMQMLMDEKADLDKNRLKLMTDLTRTAKDQAQLSIENKEANTSALVGDAFVNFVKANGINNPFKPEAIPEGRIIPGQLDIPEFENFDILDSELSCGDEEIRYEDIMEIDKDN